MKTLKIVILSLMLISSAFFSYAADPVVEKGKSIKMDYTLSVNNEKGVNEEVETSVGKQPLQFVYGDQSIIPGLENAIVGMKVGEEKTVVVASKDAYGDPDPKAVKEFPISSLPKTPEPKVGMVLQAQSPEGESFPAVIKEIKGDKVELDFNHPLAGKELTFKVKILDISDAPAAAPAAPVVTPAPATPVAK